MLLFRRTTGDITVASRFTNDYIELRDAFHQHICSKAVKAPSTEQPLDLTPAFVLAFRLITEDLPMKKHYRMIFVYEGFSRPMLNCFSPATKLLEQTRFDLDILYLHQASSQEDWARAQVRRQGRLSRSQRIHCVSRALWIH